MIGLWAAQAATIDGTLTDAAGAPIADATVVAYDSRFRFSTATTDALGRYVVEDLRGGAYRMRALPPVTSNATEVWLGGNAARTACDAEVFFLGAEETRRIDGSIPDGLTLMGQVFRSTHDPLVGAEVSVYPQSYRESGVLPRVVLTDDEGRFSVRGLVPTVGPAETDGYLVEVLEGEVPNQYFRGAFSEQDAQVVPIPGDAVDIGAWSTLEGARLEGTLLGDEGPVPGEVHLFAGGRSVVVLADSDGHWAADAIEPGEVVLWASAPGYARTHWGNVPSASPPLLVEEQGAVVTGLNFQMLPEAQLAGQIVSSEDLSGVGLVAVAEDGSIGIGSGVEADGRFTVRGMSAGRWTLEVYGAEEGFVSGALRGPDGAPIVWDVREREVRDVGRIEPPRAASVFGTVTDQQTGGPLYGAAVIAEHTETAERRLAFSEVDGRYAIVGAPAGSWTLEVTYAPFCTTDPGWVPLSWPDQVNPALAGTVLLDPEQDFEWNASLPPDNDRDLMDDRWESENGLDVLTDDSELDPDQDGFTNLVEYRLGTDPNAVFQPQRCGCDSGSNSFFGVALLSLIGARRRSSSGYP